MCAALLAGGVPALMLAIAVAKGGLANPWTIPLAVATLVVNVLIVFMDVRFGLALFILAAGMSPKLPGFYNNLRVEDFVFVLVFGVWMLKNLREGTMPSVRSPMILPFVVLTALSVLSTVWGLAIGTVKEPVYSFFLQLKRVEYYLIFWIVASTVRTAPWLRQLTLIFVISGALAAMYGLATQSDTAGTTVAAKRVVGPEGENYNTLSGYLVICIGAGLAAITGFRRTVPRALLFGSIGVCALGLLLSYSREGWIMLVGSMMVFGLTPRYRMMMILGGCILAAALLLVPPVRENLEQTVYLIQTSHEGDVGHNSLAARYGAWEYRWNGWFLKQPLIGNGVGSVALSVDNEYLLRLCEVGVIGFFAFLWWLAAIAKQIRRLMARPGLPRILSLGLGAAFVGLLIQGLVGASFTTIRTMEPFWFLLGLVTAAVTIERELEAEAAGTAPPDGRIRRARGRRLTRR